MLQARIEELTTQTQTQQAQIQEMARREEQRSVDRSQFQDMLTFVASLQNLPGVVVPPSLIAAAVPPSPPPVGTPVSILCMVVYFTHFPCNSEVTNHFASPLCSHSPLVRTRLLTVALLRSPGPGGQVAIFQRPGGLHTVGQVALGDPGGDRRVGQVARRAPGRSRYFLLVSLHGVVMDVIVDIGRYMWPCDGLVMDF